MSWVTENGVRNSLPSQDREDNGDILHVLIMQEVSGCMSAGWAGLAGREAGLFGLSRLFG